MLALQGPINSQLGKTIGNQQAAFFSFLTGTIILAVIAGLVKGGYGQIAEAKSLAPQYLIGGVLGACYVSTVIVTVRTLGAGGIVAATIAGQLTMGVIIDQFGLLGLDKDPISVMQGARRAAARRGHVAGGPGVGSPAWPPPPHVFSATTWAAAGPSPSPPSCSTSPTPPPAT